LARPRKIIDEKRIDELAELGMTDEDIGLVIGLSKSNLTRYRTRIQRGRAKLKIQLLEAMREKAITEKNPSLIKWMTINLCGWSDQVVYTDISTPKKTTIEIKLPNNPA